MTSCKYVDVNTHYVMYMHIYIINTFNDVLLVVYNYYPSRAECIGYLCEIVHSVNLAANSESLCVMQLLKYGT